MGFLPSSIESLHMNLNCVERWMNIYGDFLEITNSYFQKQAQRDREAIEEAIEEGRLNSVFAQMEIYCEALGKDKMEKRWQTQWYNECMSEWEVWKKELRFILAEVKRWSSEAQKCADHGDEEERRQWEARIEEARKHIDMLEEEIEDCREVEEVDKPVFLANCDVDEGLVDME